MLKADILSNNYNAYILLDYINLEFEISKQDEILPIVCWGRETQSPKSEKIIIRKLKVQVIC